MIRNENIVERYYTYYGRAKRDLNFSPVHGVSLRNNCYLYHAFCDTYAVSYTTNATTKIKRMKPW